MNHNIVKDKSGNEHQAVKDATEDYTCIKCSLKSLDCESIKAKCVDGDRKDKTEAMYKRRIKIADITKAKP